MITNITQIIDEAKKQKPINLTIAMPDNDLCLKSIFEAKKQGLVDKVYITAEEESLKALAKEVGVDLSVFDITFTSKEEALDLSVEHVKSGKADTIMKGNVSTSTIMAKVLKKENGLRTDNTISHIYVLAPKNYHKLLMITDSGMNILPNLETKVKILKNAIDLSNILGITKPKIALLSAIEKVNEKILSSVEAGEIANNNPFKDKAIIEGPLAFDNAISRHSAEIKNIKSEISGDCDVLLMPSLDSGNMVAKALIYLNKADAAGIMLGAKVPVILTSRSDDIPSRIASIALANLCVNKK